MLRSESLCLVQKSKYCCLKNFEHIPNFLYLETYLKFHEQHYTHKEVSLVTVADRGWWLIAYSNCDWKQLDYFIESQIILSLHLRKLLLILKYGLKSEQLKD